jgi:hypothetical protein
LPYTPHSYVIFTGPEKERLLVSLTSQLTNLSSDTYFNRSARFIVVVTGYRSEISAILHDGYSTLWIDFKIENFVIVTAKPQQPHYGINENKYGLEENIDFDIYSCYAYKSGRCGDNFQAVLVAQSYVENSGELSCNTNLFPNKIPNNFAGCVVTV